MNKKYAKPINVKNIKQLINSDYPFNENIEDGHTALIQAALIGEIECLELLLPVSDIDCQNDRWHTALMMAVLYNKEVSIKFLLENFANLNIQNEIGDNAIIIAAKHNKSALPLLIEAGATADVKNNEGHNFLFYLNNDKERSLYENMLLMQEIESDEVVSAGL